MTEVCGTLLVEDDFDCDLREAVDVFFDKYGIDPESIDGKGFIGTCDGCDCVILEGEAYAESEDDELRCMTCIDKHQQEQVEQKADQVNTVEPSSAQESELIQQTIPGIIEGEAEDPEDL